MVCHAIHYKCVVEKSKLQVKKVILSGHLACKTVVLLASNDVNPVWQLPTDSGLGK
jgi:hypothetical protein